ncbi:phosphate ABC transporter substrate-binding protein PstS [Paeniglutamicibacter psychrophenolicus]|uniref:Phosphate-binding protein n=1 Tax=Paeniglutamicibacter psychrophenolicus TaxID=257454 RepID=A0ABS4W8D7_9MICC|nr:phosphate transport system substrate-binding protein [Paeniglutamicibacter psychrophenolicus]
MKLHRIGSAAAVLTVAALALTACGSDSPTATAGTAASTGGSAAAVTGTLTGSGASSQKSAMEAWKAGFEAANPGTMVQYSPDGSGAGRKAFLAGGAQFAGSDAYLKAEEIESSKQVCGPEGAFNVPAYVSPIAVAFNLPGIETLNLDAATIAKIFKLEITKWNDPAIAAMNEGIALPDTAITVVHRNDESGTTENFVDYLAVAAKDVWTYEVSGDWPKDLASENAKGTSGVVATTTGTEGAITYADHSAVGKLGTVNVKVGEDFTKISSEAAAKGVEAATPVEGRGALDMSLDLKRDTTESGSYPIILVSYHVFCSSYKDQATVDLVKSFGEYVLSEAGQKEAAASAGNAPLSAKMSEAAIKSIDSIKVGS